MRCSQLFTATLLFIGGVTALSGGYGRSNGRGMSRTRTRRGVPKGASSKPFRNNGNGTSTNWAGAYVGVSGTNTAQAVITVPEIHTPRGSNPKKTYGGRVWAGLNGVSKHCSSFANTGVQWTIQNHHASYEAFYQLYPGPTYYFDVPIEVGQNYSFFTSVSGQSATYFISNVTTGDTLDSHTLTSKHKLCTNTCEWIVEDFAIDGKLIPLAHFDSVDIYDAFGSSPATSEVLSPALGNSVTLEQAGSNLVSCFSTSGTLSGFSAPLYECKFDN